ncbi:MAG: hypothetical protein AMJ53_13455 [Gammaproteobacteria bacterium SG8_11]|nr:MAG: hypothetical protein AMJ53_13455 [Gammaproteobacteria bacterium SG8_11]
MIIKRRDFLKLAIHRCALRAAALSAPSLVFAKSNSPAERQLAFYHLHTGEKINTTYWADGDYITQELESLNHLLRDHRTDEIQAIDKNLLDLLYVLQQQVDKSGAYHIISGYRSPKTNTKLRQQSNGVAKRSLHMQGKAIDVRLPGVQLKHLRQAALQLRAGGVGYYPKSNFVHLDTGRPRFW